MAAKKVPITGSVLAWAREEGGYSLETLAEKLKVDGEKSGLFQENQLKNNWNGQTDLERADQNILKEGVRCRI